MDDLPIQTLVDMYLGDIHAAIEANLPKMRGSRLEARDLLERILGYTPPPELLEALKQVAGAPEQSAIRMGLGRVLIALAILVRRELCALTEPSRLDSKMLRRQAEMLPAVIHRVEALEDDIRSMRPAEGRRETDRLRKLRVSLLPSLPRLQGFATLVPRVQRLAAAAIEGSLGDLGGLNQEEVVWFEAATGRSSQFEKLPPRILLDAVALRVGLTQQLEAQRRGESMAGRLRPDVAEYDLVLERLGQEEERARQAGHGGLVRRLTGLPAELARLRRRAANLRGGRSLAPGQRERRSFVRSRPAALLAVAAAVGFAAAVTVGPLRPRTGSTIGDATSGTSTLPGPLPGRDVQFTQVVRDGGTLVAEISALAWKRMSSEERQERVYALGVMAFERGMDEVWIVDGNRKELAKWPRDGSIRILGPE